MKIITSPAKLMNVENSTEFLKSTKKFIEEATLIHSYLKEKSPQYLSELMEISAKLADENWQKTKFGNPNQLPKNLLLLFFAFLEKFTEVLMQKHFKQRCCGLSSKKNHRILSGLYGLLNHQIKVMLYRLEMGRNFEFEHYKNLYEFWSEKSQNKSIQNLKK